MNTPGQSYQIQRFKSLASVHGEALTFGSVSVTALVDRNPPKGKTDKLAFRDGRMDFGLQGFTMIEVLFTALTSAPSAGDTFLDTVGCRHRVRLVEQTNVSWTIYCTSSKVP